MKPLGVCCGINFYSRTEWAVHQRQHRQEKAEAVNVAAPTREKAMSTFVKARGEIVVVETEDDAFVGFVEEEGDTIVIRTGFRGHPFVLQKWEVESIEPAKDHPYVEWL